MLWTRRGGAFLKRYKRPSKADEHDMCLQDGLLHVRSPLLWGFTMGRTPTWKQWRRNTRTGLPSREERGDVHAMKIRVNRQKHHETCRKDVETSWQNFHVWHKILQVYRIHLLPSICIRLLDVLQRYQDLFRRRLNSTGDPVPFNVFKTYMMEARWIAWILCQCHRLKSRNL